MSSPATLKALDDGLYSAHIAASPEDFRERTDPLPTQANGGSIGIQSHLSDKIGFAWHYDSTFNEDVICDIFGGVSALIAIGALLVDDLTGIGVVDDILIPAIGAVAGACAIENLAEEYLSGYLNCESYTWVYEVYLPDWWNPLGPIIVSTCK